jgi:predicted dehydrogenase
MTERVRVGVIGTGAIATLRHLPAFATSAAKGAAEIVAVADVDEASARAAAERFGAQYAFTDYRDLLQAPIDAVSICTPNAYHEPAALAALDAGKHVICEKPLALDFAGAKRMSERAAASGLKHAVNFRYRWVPAAAYVRDLIAAGELGEIYHVFAHYFNGTLHDPQTPIRWRQTRAAAGTGVLGDLGSHMIDLCRWWVGEVASVQGHLRTFNTRRPLVGGGIGDVDVDDFVSCHLAFASGAEGVLNASQNAIGRNNHQRLELYGTKGALIYEIEKWDDGGDTLQICFGSAQARYNAFSTVKVPPAYLAGNPERPMIDFIDAIRADQMPSPNFDDGMRCQEVIDAIALSAQRGTRVELPLPLD